MEVRIPILAQFINQHHCKHPNPNLLFKDRKLLIQLSEECPKAVEATEAFLQMPRNTIKKWIQTTLTYQVYGGMSKEEQAVLLLFIEQFITRIPLIPNDLFVRAAFYFNCKNDKYPIQIIKKQCQQIVRSKEVQQLLKEQNKVMPNQRYVAEELIKIQIAKFKQEKSRIETESCQEMTIDEELQLLIGQIMQGKEVARPQQQAESTEAILKQNQELKELFDIK